MEDGMSTIKIVVEKHPEGYVAYPLGIEGVIAGEGETYEEALSDVRSAIRFHLETFGAESLSGDAPVLEAFGFAMVREREHIAMVRQNEDGSKTPLTLPNHSTIKGATLRVICRQSNITREEFLSAYEKT
jgi:predicted RNase H-like HicB family nuclease